MRQQTLKRLLIVVMVLAVAGTAAHYLWRDRGAAPAAYPAAAAQAVPVKADAARRGDIDLSLKVIGSAQPWSTVTVQARVDGQLESLSFKPGGHVGRGETIIRIDPGLLKSQLDEALGNLAKDQAQRVNAQSLLRRYRPLLAKGYVAKSAYDTAKADAGVYPGAQVTANSTNLVVLNQVQPIHITFAVPEAELAALKAAYARGVVPVSARLPGSKADMQATLDFINNAVDTSTGTIQLKARYANRDDELTPGQFVEVTLPTASLKSVVTVPAVALQNSPTGSFVFVIDDSGVAHQRMVTVGASTADRVVITEGLQGGERVVTDGQLLLVDGAHVRMLTGG